MAKKGPYYFDRIWVDDKPCLVIYKKEVVEVKIMPDENEEDWRAAVAELDRLNAEWRKEQK